MYDDNKRLQFREYILKNKLMTESELDKFMEGMKQKIHIGYQPEQLAQLEKNKAIEFIYNKNISYNSMPGLKYKIFSINSCIDAKTGAVNLEALRKILN